MMSLPLFLFFFKQKTAYEMRISDWSSDVCSSDLFRWDDAIRRSRRFGRLFRAIETVLVSPGIHHTHHGYGRDGASFRNYAVTFSFLDRIFGTLHIPEGRPANYGLPGPTPPWFEEVFFPVFGWTRGRRAARSEESRVGKEGASTVRY